MAEKTKLKFHTFDVFTDEPYKGNPLAVVLVPPSTVLSQEQKQTIAREFNYSETVILHEATEVGEKPEWKIDIFLTTGEIPFAGHPTVGTSCFLGGQLLTSRHGDGKPDALHGTLITKSGRVPFAFNPQSQVAEIRVPHDVHVHKAILSAHDAEAVGFPRLVRENIVNKPPLVSLVKGVTFFLVQLPSEEVLAAVGPGYRAPQPDASSLTKEWSPEGKLLAFYFYVRIGQAKDGTTKLRTRMVLGHLEDPATGAAASTLAAYLAMYDPDNGNGKSPSTHKFEIVQGVEMGRKSIMGLEVKVDSATNQVDTLKLDGHAVGVMEGSLVI